MSSEEINEHSECRDMKRRKDRRQSSRWIFDEVDCVKPFDKDFAECRLARRNFSPAISWLNKQPSPARRGRFLNSGGFHFLSHTLAKNCKIEKRIVHLSVLMPWIVAK